MQIRARLQRGDTIVEVMFAIVIFSMLAVGAIAIMNSGTATAEHSLEITLVQSQINAQANALRYIHDSYVENFPYTSTAACNASAACMAWQQMTSKYAETQASPYGVTNGATCQVPIVASQYKPFILDAQTATVWSQTPVSISLPGSNPPSYSQVVYKSDGSIQNAYGIWIEAVPAAASGSDSHVSYVDFHIRACWESPGSAPASTLGTIVRLYEPVS